MDDRKANPPDPQGSNGDHSKNAIWLLTTSPMNVLREAIKAVPQLKYALAVLGIVAVISISLTFKLGFRVAVIGTLIMLVLMVAVVIFAALTKASGALRIAAIIMMFAFLILMIATVTFITTSVFFQWPRDLRYWVTGEGPVIAKPSPTPMSTPTPAPVPDSASIVLREGRTLQSAIDDIAELADSRAVVEKCSRRFMNSIIRGGGVRDETIEKLLDQLQFRIQKPKTREKYTVMRDSMENTYVIRCATN